MTPQQFQEQPQLGTLLQKLKQQLEQHYRDKLERVILFGSQARLEANSDSDIDIAVILKGAISPVQEIKNNNLWLSELCLETNALINCLYLSTEQYQTKETPLIRNIKAEGILV
jgi:uncharacterized protein